MSQPDPELLGRLRAALEAEPLALVILFGSAARGALHAGSDLDLAVRFSSGERTLWEELAVEQRLSDACGREVSLVHLDAASDLLGWRIARDGVLLKGSRAEFLRFVVRAARQHADMAEPRAAAERRFRERLAGSG